MAADYRALFDSAPSPLLVLGTDLVIVAANRAYLAVSGAAPGTLEGQHLLDAFPADDPESGAETMANLVRSLETVRETGRPDTMPVQRYDLQVDGRPVVRYWSPVNTPVFDADGRVHQFLHRVEDVTDRVGNADLELFLRSRELKADNDRLAATGRELRLRNEAKDRFVATLSHELRNPLAALRAAGDVLGLDLPAGHPALAVLDRQVEAMARITEDLLDATRAQTGRIDLADEPLDLRALVLAAVADLGVDGIEPVLPEEPAVVRGDRVRLGQVLANLLGNAVKYGRGTPVVVEVAQRPEAVVLSVRDGGAGFEPADAEILFEAFTRVVPAGPADPGGLGLGLSVVRGVVDLHGGSVAATSPGPGLGAEFTVRLPPAEVLDALPDPAARRALRVLVAEHSVERAEAYAALLRRRGDRVAVVGTGRAALAAARAEPYDLLLCDVGLPDLDGREVAAALVGTAAQPRWMVAVSGVGGEAQRASSGAAGFAAHLPKPVSMAVLDELLADWERAGR